MVFKPGRVTLHPGADRCLALAPVQRDMVGKRLDLDLVAPPAPEQAEAKHHRRIEQAGEQQRTQRKLRRAAKKIAGAIALVCPGTVAEDADDLSASKAFLHAQQRVGFAKRNHARRDAGGKRMQHAVDLGGAAEMHQHVHRGHAVGEAARAQDFEAAQVRPQQNAAAFLPQHCRDLGRNLEPHVEVAILSGPQIDPVVNRRGIDVVMAEDVAQRGRPAEHAPQVVGGSAPRAHRERHEVSADRVEEPTPDAAPERERDPRQQAHGALAPALALPEPGGVALVMRAKR